jgi:hypothetical protein
MKQRIPFRFYLIAFTAILILAGETKSKLEKTLQPVIEEDFSKGSYHFISDDSYSAAAIIAQKYLNK